MPKRGIPATQTVMKFRCDKCGTLYELTWDKWKRRNRKGTPNYCKKCMKEYTREKQKNYYSQLQPEEQQKFKDKRNWYARATPEQKAVHSQKTKDQLARRTEEEWKAVNQKNSEGLKKHWKTVTDEERAARTTPMLQAIAEKRATMTPEEKSAVGRKWFDNLSPEEQDKKRQELSERMRAYNATIPDDVKEERVKAMQRWHDNLTPEEKQALYQRTHAWYHNLSDEEKINYAKSKGDWYQSLSPEEKEAHRQATSSYWNNLTDEQKIAYKETRANAWRTMPIDRKKASIRKALSSSGSSSNNLTNRFEEAFSNSRYSNMYNFKREVVCSDAVIHSWDYGIYDKDGKLVMVVDLDGAFFHADNSDYNGIHSKEEYDEIRSTSVSDDVKIIIINELNFDRTFAEMTRVLEMSYDDYVRDLFKHFRAMPFPQPSYTNMEMAKAYHRLVTMRTDDSLHGDISLNTRIGDRIITNFHESIYRAHVDGKPSPYDAWNNDDLLMKCIRNRTIYQSYLNPNKILQGFNVSKIAPKVSVFSAGRAKLLIHKYLNEFDTIFDPFSGFSGRMLGAMSMNKKYIGQDLDVRHVNESNKIIDFLRSIGEHVNAEVIQANVFESYGAHECLFTCPPYSNKEVWLEGQVTDISCDEWIKLCLDHFLCQRYVFVIDYTEAYIGNVVDEIVNRSHLGSNSEYVVVIDR